MQNICFTSCDQQRKYHRVDFFPTGISRLGSPMTATIPHDQYYLHIFLIYCLLCHQRICIKPNNNARSSWFPTRQLSNSSSFRLAQLPSTHFIVFSTVKVFQTFQLVFLKWHHYYKRQCVRTPHQLSKHQRNGLTTLGLLWLRSVMMVSFSCKL